MKRIHGSYEFESSYVEDNQDGWAGLDLYRTSEGAKRHVARVAFWDASGEFVIETFDGDVPLIVIEALIEEAKREIKTS